MWTIIGTVAGVIGLGISIFFLLDWFKKGKKIKELREEVKKRFDSMSKEMVVYRNGLLELRKKEKLVLIRDGLVAMGRRDHKTAIDLFQKCLSLASNDSERCAFLNQIGLNQLERGNIREAERTFLEMIDIAEKVNMEEALAKGLGNIGIVYLTQSKFQKALEYHRRALKIAKKIDDLTVQANEFTNIAKVYEASGELENAKDFHQRALRIDKEMDNLRNQACDLANLGSVYFALRQFRESINCYQRSYEISERIGAGRLVMETAWGITRVTIEIEKQKGKK